MKKIFYKKLTAKNFLSIGEQPISLDYTKGVHQIEGINLDCPDRRNGTGKTTIFQAHFFALFGETINKIKSDNIPNNLSKGKGIVTLEFDIQENDKTKSYKIVRQVKPSKVELYENGVDISRDSIANTNKHICKILSTNPVIYKCCDVLTVRDTKVFMDMDAEDKRKFIEDVFDINVFSLMLKELKSRITENNQNLNSTKTKLNTILNSLETIEKLKADMARQIEEYDERKKQRIEQIREEIEIYEDANKSLQSFNLDVKPLKEKIVKIDERLGLAESKISEIEQKRMKVRHDLSVVKNDLVNLEDDTRTVCDKCGQNLPHDHVEHTKELKKQLLEDIDKFENELNSLNELARKYNDAKIKLKNQKLELKDDIDQVNRNLVKIENNNERISMRLKNIEEIEKEELDTFALKESEKELEKYNNEKLETETTLKSYQDNANTYNTCKFILGEEGVKSFVVKKLLKLLNDTIEYYLVRFGLGVRCKFDEYFDEVVTNDKGKTFSYKNASGAEKKSLDFACVFAFSEMRRKISQVYSNVLLIDEILDNALDEVGLDLIMGELKERVDSSDLGVYVISHKKEMKKHIDGDTITIQKKDGFSKRLN